MSESIQVFEGQGDDPSSLPEYVSVNVKLNSGIGYLAIKREDCQRLMQIKARDDGVESPRIGIPAYTFKNGTPYKGGKLLNVWLEKITIDGKRSSAILVATDYAPNEAAEKYIQSGRETPP